MEPITYTNIVVEGVPFTKVLALEIAHAINEHGTAGHRRRDGSGCCERIS